MNKEDDFWLEIFSISGGLIISHLGLLQELYDARIYANGGKKDGYYSYAPHACFGSSGGNITAFIGAASDWTSDGIARNVQHMDSNLFLKKWVPDNPLMPDLPFALITGSIYNKGYGAEGLFNNLFTSESIQRTELWLGAYDVHSKKAQFFCNRSQGDSYISEAFFNEEQSLYHAMPLIFTNGDVNKLAKVCVASATIPVTVPSQEIDGRFYADGGVMYASPLSVLHKEVLRIITGKERVPISRSFQIEKDTQRNYECTRSEKKKHIEKNLRLIYFFPYQPNGLQYPGKNKDLGIKTYLDSILNVNMMQDRNTAIEVLNILCPEGLETETYIKLGSSKKLSASEELGEIIKKLSDRKHFMICLFPHLNPSINITHITGPTMLAGMELAKSGYGCQIWYSKRFINNK